MKRKDERKEGRMEENGGKKEESQEKQNRGKKYTYLIWIKLLTT